MGWLSGWFNRRGVEVHGSTEATTYNFRFTIYKGSGTTSGTTVYLNGKCRDDFGDIRFTDYDGATLLDYWIQTYTSGNVAYVWVEVPDIPANDVKTIYLYYNNSSATSTSNFVNTFQFADDFNRADSSTVGNGWTEDEDAGVGAASIELEQLKIVQYGNYYCHVEKTAPSFPNQIIIGKIRLYSGAAGASWMPALVFYWDYNDYCRLGIRNTTTDARVYVEGMKNGTSFGNGNNGQTLDGNTYYWFRIKLTDTTVFFDYSTNGINWTAVSGCASTSRASTWSGAPSLIILGKGYGDNTYSNPDLDNNYSSAGSSGTSYFDDVFITKFLTTEPYIGSWYNEEGFNVYSRIPSNFASSSVYLRGELGIPSGESWSERGFEWGTSSGSYPNSWTETGTFGSGTYSHQITSISGTYYFRAKAYRSDIGWMYGEEIRFATVDWVTNWERRKPHLLKKTSTSTSYFKVTVHYGSGIDSDDDMYCGGNCQADFDDIRFVYSGSSFLNYWMQEKVNSDYAVFWVKTSVDLSVSNTVVHVYYGNSSASSASDGAATFYLFDDFNTWNSSIWGSQPSWVTLSDGIMTIAANAGDVQLRSISPYIFGFNRTVESRMRCSPQNIDGSMGFMEPIGNTWSTNLVRFYINSDGATNWHLQSVKSGSSYAWQSNFTIDGSNFHILKCKRFSSTLSKYQKDNETEVEYTNSNYIPTGNLCVGFRHYNTTTVIYVDWIFVRDAEEATHSEWGTEESGGALYEIFISASTSASLTKAFELSIPKNTTANASTSKTFELGIPKNASVTSSTSKTLESLFNLLENATVTSSTSKAFEIGIPKNANVTVSASKLLESLFNLFINTSAVANDSVEVLVGEIYEILLSAPTSCSLSKAFEIALNKNASVSANDSVLVAWALLLNALTHVSSSPQIQTIFNILEDTKIQANMDLLFNPMFVDDFLFKLKYTDYTAYVGKALILEWREKQDVNVAEKTIPFKQTATVENNFSTVNKEVVNVIYEATDEMKREIEEIMKNQDGSKLVTIYYNMLVVKYNYWIRKIQTRYIGNANAQYPWLINVELIGPCQQ